MKTQMSMFGIALLIMILIVAIILGFAAGPTSPLTWALVGFLFAIPYLHRRYSMQNYVEWDDKYSVGIESIDKQHKRLIDLINQLKTAVDYSTDEEFERSALTALVDYTKTHFTYEEELMEKYGYPDYESHQAEHQKMIREVEKVLKEYEEDHDRAMEHALAFLKSWLINHINGTDKQYSDFLISKGVK